MALKPGLQLKQSQRLSLTPALRQSIKVLGLPAVALSDLIAGELAANPLLNTETSAPPPDLYQFATQTVAADKTLSEHLHEQINWMSADRSSKNAAHYIIENLDSDGYLSDAISQVSVALDCTDLTSTEGLKLVQSCEPTGIAARSLEECLELQLRENDLTQVQVNLVLNNLKDLGQRNWGALKRKTGLSLDELNNLFAVLTSLKPFPASDFKTDSNQALYPDVLITSDDNITFRVELTNSQMQSLSVDAAMLAQMESEGKENTGPLEEYKARANDLINALEARSKTVLRVTNAIVALQYQFFQSGPEHLRPLTLAKLADSLKLHPSTISRTLSQKSLSCRFGVFPLRFFLNVALPSLDREKVHSAYVIQLDIQKLIAAESVENPLSDAALTKILRRKGVDITRRTVAKYRQCLNIRSSFQRRRPKP